MEIAAGVHVLPIPSSVISAYQPPNVYLLLGRRSVLIDTGHDHEEPLKARLEYVKRVAPALDLIVGSHAHQDHVGGVAGTKRATGARFAIHRADAAEARRRFSLEPDQLLEDGDVVDLGGRRLEVVHTPGHTPGHICLYLRDEAILFSADLVVGMGTTAIEPPEGDMADYLRSLRRLLDYDVRLLCPGHGPLVRDPCRKIEQLIQQRLERELQVLDGLRRGLSSPGELAADLYPELKGNLLQVAQRHITAHLLKLEKEARAVRHKGGWRLAGQGVPKS